ncbi:DNA topoisomerase (ATP-hydrolyzing) subunit B [Candidatus Woesearchaeota archaeon]|nr:DNA topoisomerase (ATP-hydrolyzing) subunit B [Candidatus Woesearchaeota archaeon]
MKPDEYNAEKITVLAGIEAIRKRPGMYIGSTGTRGLHHLVYEVVDNSIDEALAGYCTEIKVIIHKDNSITVIDNGRGIPVDNHPKYNKPAVEVIMTKLHAGGKFDKKTYKVSGGLHGVGISVVNALSENFKVFVMRNNKVYFQEYKKGKPVAELKTIRETKKTGTKVTFVPDKEIFNEINYQFEVLSSRLRELAFLNKGIKISLIDKRSEKKKTFQYEGGLISFVKYLNQNKGAFHKVIYFQKYMDTFELEAAIQYTNSYTEHIFTFVNNINTVEGGMHLSGFKSALTRTINRYAEQNNLSKGLRLGSDDVREGMTAVLSIKIPEPQFEGQTKTKLGNSEVKGMVDSIMSEKLSVFFEENPKTANEIINKALKAAKAREAARKARELVRRKSLLEGTTLPGKLSDCSNQDPEKCELFIVEGDSAGGSAKQGRNREFQAVLPLRGKILNVEKSRLNKILNNNEIVAIITALGTGIDEDFDIRKLRYHKIIIMTDSDVDGAHIAILLLTFFYRYLKPLIENGHVYVAKPPLYKIKKGKYSRYIQDENQKRKILKKFEGKKVTLQRFKGLGEMNPTQLWETTMDTQKRTLKKITIDDAVEADKTFTTLMGQEVAPRKKFIKEHALEVDNIDT